MAANCLIFFCYIYIYTYEISVKLVMKEVWGKWCYGKQDSLNTITDFAPNRFVPVFGFLPFSCCFFSCSYRQFLAPLYLDRGGFSHKFYWASVYAERLGCRHMGLQATVSWWGKRGLNLRACSHFLRNIAHQQPAAPFLLLVHVGTLAWWQRNMIWS